MRYLICPHCGANLRLDSDTARCTAGHTFDIARQGYLNLLAGGRRQTAGDSAAMISARHDFLTAGHYSPIAGALADAAASAPDVEGCVLDLGAGTGHYLASVLDRLPERAGLALDVSRFALRRAARAHPRIAAIGADAWAPLPIRSSSVALMLNVFAPRNAIEIRRVLVPGGELVVVTPTSEHLRELVTALGLIRVDPDKQDRLERAMSPQLRLSHSTRHDFTLQLSPAEVRTVVAMGPSARHLDPTTLDERIAVLANPALVTASVTVSTYRS